MIESKNYVVFSRSFYCYILFRRSGVKLRTVCKIKREQFNELPQQL